jgi:hypothetical protein
MNLEGTKARNDCAGEYQQQFNRPTELSQSRVKWKSRESEDERVAPGESVGG